MLSWTWKDRLTFTNESLSFEIGFTSNGQHFDKLLVQKEDAARYLGYCNGSTCTLAYDSGTWNNTAFKKLTFDTLPTKELWALMVFQATADAAVSKVEVNGVTLIDISYDTVTPATLAKRILCPQCYRGKNCGHVRRIFFRGRLQCVARLWRRDRKRRCYCNA